MVLLDGPIYLNVPLYIYSQCQVVNENPIHLLSHIQIMKVPHLTVCTYTLEKVQKNRQDHETLTSKGARKAPLNIKLKTQPK
jgi:hypothetical protein